MTSGMIWNRWCMVVVWVIVIGGMIGAAAILLEWING
jgi:hypothetical protein